MIITNTFNIIMGIFVVFYVRIVEIYLTVSLGPIPLATIANKEWSSIGQNYLNLLFSLGFQALLITVYVGIYAVLVQSIAIDADIMREVWTRTGYLVPLCFTLFKTGGEEKCF